MVVARGKSYGRHRHIRDCRLSCDTPLHSQPFARLPHPLGGEGLSGIAGEVTHYLRIGHIEAFRCRLRFRGKGEITEQQFHLCRIDLEGFAVSMQFYNLFIIEPIAKPLIQPCLGFAVNGIHRNALSSVYIYCQYLKRQKASAPCRSVRKSLPLTEATKLAKWGRSSMCFS